MNIKKSSSLEDLRKERFEIMNEFPEIGPLQKRVYKAESDFEENIVTAMFSIGTQPDGRVWITMIDHRRDSFGIGFFSPEDGKLHLMSGAPEDIFQVDGGGYVVVERDSRSSVGE